MFKQANYIITSQSCTFTAFLHKGLIAPATCLKPWAPLVIFN